MNAHVHIGAVDAFHFGLMLIVVGFILRMISYHTADKEGALGTMGKALSFIY